MKSISKIIITTLLVLFTASSCTDFLDREPHTLVLQTYFNNESELDAFLTSVYAPMTSSPFYGFYYPLYIASGDDLTFFQRNYTILSIVQANANSGNNHITVYWRALYEGVNRANILLENVDKNNEIPDEFRKRVRAEALFLRSFYYFNLIQGWGDVPFRTESVKTVVGIDAPRTDKQIIYDRITADIADAIPNLYASTDISYTGRVTQSAARGILARIYLFRAGEHLRDKKPAGNEVQSYFEQAKKWGLEVKNSNIHGLVSPYKRIFLDLTEDEYNSTGVLESIWEAEFAGTGSTPERAAGIVGSNFGFGSKYDYSLRPEIQNLSGMSNPGYSYRFLHASLKLFLMYEEEVDTVRGDWNIANYEYMYASTDPWNVVARVYYFGKRPEGLYYVEGFPCTELSKADSDKDKTRCMAKYRREHEPITPKDKNFTPTNYPILRYSDVLLMIAEAENEINGPTTLAYECINAVRTRAKISPLNGLSKEDFREAIKKERAMELCFESLRRWDLIRWGDFYNNMKEMSTYVQMNSWSSIYKYALNYYNVTEAYNYYPIPDMETSTNKLIGSNNPGW